MPVSRGSSATAGLLVGMAKAKYFKFYAWVGDVLTFIWPIVPHVGMLKVMWRLEFLANSVICWIQYEIVICFVSLSGCMSLIFVNSVTKIVGCYYHDIVLMQQMLPSISFHCWWRIRISARQCILRSSSFNVKQQNSLLQTSGLQIVLTP